MSTDSQAGPVSIVGEDGGAVSELVASVGFRVLPANRREAAATVVAVGESALLRLAREGCPTPILPVEIPAAIETVSADGLQRALEALRAGQCDGQSHPTFAVSVDGDRRATGLADVMLVTAEPAHISEYAIATPAGPLSRFRADGVVAATPAGSDGYAKRVGGPVLDPDVAGLSVVPVGAFKTERDHWVVSLPVDGPALTMTVERDEAPIDLLVDHRRAGRLSGEETLSLERDGELTLLTVPGSDAAIGAHRTDRPDASTTPFEAPADSLPEE